MGKWRSLMGLMFMAAVMFMIASCGPSSDPAVEKLLSHGLNIDSDRFKALTPEQQAEALRLAKERHLVVIGDEKRY